MGKNERTIRRYTNRKTSPLRSIKLTPGRTGQAHYNLADIRRFLGLDGAGQ